MLEGRDGYDLADLDARSVFRRRPPRSAKMLPPGIPRRAEAKKREFSAAKAPGEQPATRHIGRLAWAMNDAFLCLPPAFAGGKAAEFRRARGLLDLRRHNIGRASSP
jgi:hypothetical protein